jgi:hypothetical protein
MAATTARLLADLPHEPGYSPVPGCDAGTPVVAARLALAPASDNLRPLRPVRLRALTQRSGTLRAQRTTWPPARTCCRPAAIMTHASEIILRTLAVGASQLSLDRLRRRAARRSRSHGRNPDILACSHRDIVTTDAWPGIGLTPVAHEDDLVVQTGRLAYRNPRRTHA